MSTDLVVVIQSQVINNYRDVMNADMTVGFVAMGYDANEFEEAKSGTIQDEFWKKYSETRIIMNLK